MKKILTCFLIASFAATVAQAQESAMQQEIDKLNGQIQDMEAAQAAQEKRISALEKQINNLSSQLNQPAASGFASQDDLKKLAEQVQEIDKKRQDDNKRVLKELEQLEKSLGASPPSRKAGSVASADDSTPATHGKENGFYYEVRSGNTLSAIAKAYTDKGHKVTVKQILDANAGLDPKNLKVGQKIFIPAPTQ